MKRKIILMFISAIVGVCFTFYYLNRDNFYAKEKYSAYILQSGAYESLENANNKLSNLPNGIVINDEELYKIYVGIYNDIDLVNKMLVYFENNGINVYLKNENISKDLYEQIREYEKILNNTEEEKVYSRVNQAILELYKEHI